MADTITWSGGSITTPVPIDCRPRRQTHRVSDRTESGVSEVWVHRIDRLLEVTIELIPVASLASYENLLDRLMSGGTITLTKGAVSATFDLAQDEDPQLAPMEDIPGYYSLQMTLRRVDGGSALPFVTI